MSGANRRKENRLSGNDGSQLATVAIAGRLLAPVAAGELIDKITILEIKAERIGDASKLRNIQSELGVLTKLRDAHIPSPGRILELTRQLKQVNASLWNIEDEIRDCERRQDFGARFIELARSVYRNNDDRSRLKREINQICGSPVVEEKSYAPY